MPKGADAFGVPVQSHIERGEPAAMLLDHAQRADMLVVGNHGRGGSPAQWWARSACVPRTMPLVRSSSFRQHRRSTTFRLAERDAMPQAQAAVPAPAVRSAGRLDGLRAALVIHEPVTSPVRTTTGVLGYPTRVRTARIRAGGATMASMAALTVTVLTATEPPGPDPTPPSPIPDPAPPGPGPEPTPPIPPPPEPGPPVPPPPPGPPDPRVIPCRSGSASATSPSSATTSPPWPPSVRQNPTVESHPVAGARRQRPGNAKKDEQQLRETP